MFLDPELYCSKKDLQESVQRFFDITVPYMNLTSSCDQLLPESEGEVVMDVGSGPGRVTSKMIVPLFPNLKKLYGVDLLPNMIEYAQSKNPHPKIEYTCASIEDWATVQRWEGQISKVLSIHCFSWLKNQKQGFENIYRLLKPDGQAAFVFCLHTPFYQAVEDIAKDPSWKIYFENVHRYIPESHFKKYDSSYYKEMLEEIGFTVVYAESCVQPDTFATDELFRDFFASICVLVGYVPIERREEFKDELFQYNIRLNGRNSEGLAIHNATILQLVVKKD